MGAAQTTESLPSKPWRKAKNSNWNEEYCTEIIDEINTFGDESSTRRANCLVLGPNGVGKSAFINSVLSVSKGRYSDISYTGNLMTSGSETIQYCSYETRDKLKHVYMRDTSGIMEVEQTGFNVENIIALVGGHFDPINTIQETDKFYNKSPAEEDKIHCATFVMDARPGYDDLGQNFLHKIKILQQKLKDKDIPRVLILTKCDTLCPHVERDTKNIYYSTRVKEAVDEASKVFDIQKSNIYPVVNYGDGQIYLEPEISIPILLALRQINNSAKDHQEKQEFGKNKMLLHLHDCQTV